MKRTLLLAFALAACSSTPADLPPPQLPQRAGVDPIIAARAEGVVFRAQGVDFVLDLYRDNRIFVSWEPGAHREQFPASERTLPAWNGEIYASRNETYDLRVEIRHAPCRDGERVFSDSVVVTINGEERRGCGSPL